MGLINNNKMRVVIISIVLKDGLDTRLTLIDKQELIYQYILFMSNLS